MKIVALFALVVASLVGMAQSASAAPTGGWCYEVGVTPYSVRVCP